MIVRGGALPKATCGSRGRDLRKTPNIPVESAMSWKSTRSMAEEILADSSSSERGALNRALRNLGLLEEVIAREKSAWRGKATGSMNVAVPPSEGLLKSLFLGCLAGLHLNRI